MDWFVSHPLDVPEQSPDAHYTRADLIFEGVDHSGPSYLARIFLNNVDANAQTATDSNAGFAGSFTIFGHHGCVGEEGHCDPGARTTDVFDVRAPHPLEPVTKIVTVTDALARIDTRHVTVTVVPVVPRADGPQQADVLTFTHLRLATYLQANRH